MRDSMTPSTTPTMIEACMDTLESMMIQSMEWAQVILKSNCAEAIYGIYILLIVFHRLESMDFTLLLDWYNQK